MGGCTYSLTRRYLSLALGVLGKNGFWKYRNGFFALIFPFALLVLLKGHCPLRPPFVSTSSAGLCSTAGPDRLGVDIDGFTAVQVRVIALHNELQVG